MAQRKMTCKEATSQDLTDHRGLREQLRTIRTASLEERHGRERDRKAEKNVTESENRALNTTLQMRWRQQARVWPNLEPGTQLYTKYDIESLGLGRTVLHRIILFNPGVVSEFYWWWCEQTSVRIIYPLSSDSSAYFNKLRWNTSWDSAHL